MHLNTFPNSSACRLPEGVNSPPHLRISSNDASRGTSADSNNDTKYIQIVTA